MNSNITINDIIKPIQDYLISITRNNDNRNYDLEIGIPNSWVFEENNKIKCEILDSNDIGKILKISSKENNIDIDSLISFVKLLINTNEEISNKEKEFKKKLEEMRNILEKEAQEFYSELDKLKSESFKVFNDDASTKTNTNKSISSIEKKIISKSKKNETKQKAN